MVPDSHVAPHRRRVPPFVESCAIHRSLEHHDGGLKIVVRGPKLDGPVMVIVALILSAMLEWCIQGMKKLREGVRILKEGGRKRKGKKEERKRVRDDQI